MKINMGIGFVSGLALAGCLSAAPDDAAPAAQDDAEQSSRTTAGTPIWIHSDAGVGFVRYREGADGPWLAPTQLKVGTYEAQVSGPYTVMVVCPFGDGHASTVLSSQTLDDEPIVWTQCLFDEPTTTLTGAMAQPGRVAVGDFGAVSQQANWSFTLWLYPGTYDVVANSTDRIAIQRNLTVASDRSMPPIDLNAQGAALVPTPVTFTNPLPGDTFRSQTYLRTLRTFAILGNRDLPAMMVPPSVLAPSDRADTSFRAYNFDGNASVIRFLRRAPSPGAQQPPVTFGSHFTGLSTAPDENGDLRASWTSLHSDITYFSANDFLGNTLDHAVSASYLDAMGSHSVTLDTQVPGYEPSWRLDLSAYSSSINAQYGTIDGGGLASYLRAEDFFADAAAARRDGRAAELAQQKARAEQRQRVQPDGFVKKLPAGER